MTTWIEWLGYFLLTILASITAATTHYFLKTIFEDHRQIGINEQLNTQRYVELKETLHDIQTKLAGELDGIHKQLSNIEHRLNKIENRLKEMEKTLNGLSDTVSKHDTYLIPLRLERETDIEDLQKFKEIADLLIKQKLKEIGEDNAANP